MKYFCFTIALFSSIICVGVEEPHPIAEPAFQLFLASFFSGLIVTHNEILIKQLKK